MTPVLPLVFVPGLLCSARLYASQIAALWQFGPVIVADHRRDSSMEAIAKRILADAPPRDELRDPTSPAHHELIDIVQRLATRQHSHSHLSG